MRFLQSSMALAIVITGASLAQPADAAGCIKGAILGGLAGHLAGHGLLGASAGCVVGRANANAAAKRKIAESDRAYEPAPNYQPPISNYQQPKPFNGSDPRSYGDGSAANTKNINANAYRQ